MLLIVIVSAAIMTVRNRNRKEGFGDGLLYGWGRYNPSYDTQYDQGCIERRQDGTRAAYSSALGDGDDFRRMAKLADFENTTVRHGVRDEMGKVVLFPETGCNEGSWVIPKIVDVCKTRGPQNIYEPCPVSCSRCSLAYAGSVMQDQVRPRGIYTTSLLAGQMAES